MNPDVNIQVFETAVGSNTEGTFTDAFWDELSGVCNALDNIKARRYTCGKCVLHLKPLLESGTLGTMANNEVRACVPAPCLLFSPHPHAPRRW
jgi:ubiquitin-activating enzyme E1